MPILPVHLPEQNDDGTFEQGLDFGDYSRMQTHNHVLYSGRDHTPPSWATNLRELGELLARYFELRAGIHYPRIDSPERRVVFAQTKIIADRPACIARLDRLCKEADVRNPKTTPERRCVLEKQIQALDGKLRIDDRGPALVVGIIHYFFRCGHSSAETSAALNQMVSPVGVRQIASRLERLWEKMQDGADRKPTDAERRKAKRRTWWAVSGYKQKQLVKERARRAAETSEQREKRLRYNRQYYYAHHARIRAQQKANWKKRDAAMLAYRSMTPEQIEERRAKARIYVAKRREELNADQRRRYAARVAKMSPEAKAILHEQQRRYRETHKEQRAAVVARMKGKRRQRRGAMLLQTFAFH